MLFNSIKFVIFFPAVVLMYFILPKKLKNPWLLAASYIFYMCWNVKYVLLILTSTAVTYLSGVLMERAKGSAKPERLKKLVLAGSLIINLGILFFYKYYNFAVDMLNAAGSLVNISFAVPKFDIILPVGISFYTFQALSYSIDVYRGTIAAERSFIRYALFVSFFPQLVAGPIERSKHLLEQLSEYKPFSMDNARDGFLIMLWGYFLKIVIADRAAVFVDNVYADIGSYTGWYPVVATVLFAVQIYCDFYGYSTIAVGAARVLGIRLTDNFNAPYLSVSVAEFWRNWHISLTTWFKDYLYIPLGGSRKGTVRKYLNKMTVFLVSGLWHGAELSFVIWGGLNGLYQVADEITLPMRKRVCGRLRINRESAVCKAVSGVITFVLVDFAWIFFRANTAGEALRVIGSIFSADNFRILYDGSLFSAGLDVANMWLLVICIAVLVAADILRKKGISALEKLCGWSFAVRSVAVSLAILAILLFGKWGPSFDKVSFIYFQF